MSWKSVSDDKNFICHDFRLGFCLPNCHFKCGNDYIWKPAWSFLSYLISKQIYRRALLVGQATTGDPSITTGWGLDKGHLLFCGLLPWATWTKWTNLDAAQQLDIPRTYDHICVNSYLHTSLLTVFKAQWCYRHLEKKPWCAFTHHGPPRGKTVGCFQLLLLSISGGCASALVVAVASTVFAVSLAATSWLHRWQRRWESLPGTERI